jgi:hypothetical protein
MNMTRAARVPSRAVRLPGLSPFASKPPLPVGQPRVRAGQTPVRHCSPAFFLDSAGQAVPDLVIIADSTLVFDLGS